MKDKGLKITDEDLKYLKEKSAQPEPAGPTPSKKHKRRRRRAAGKKEQAEIKKEEMFGEGLPEQKLERTYEEYLIIETTSNITLEFKGQSEMPKELIKKQEKMEEKPQE